MPFKSETQRTAYMRQYMRKRREKNFDLQQFLNDISHCPECKAHPAVFLTSGKIPVCKKHWNTLSDAPVEWLEEGKCKVCIVKN